jgi:predicted alpha/beta hydrolase family esterase
MTVPHRGPDGNTGTTLILPGLYDSGPAHWQSHWERSGPPFKRVRHRNWETPDREDWVTTLDAAIAGANGEILLVAHSTACALVAFWAAASPRRIRGALLVGPSDTEAPSYPVGPTGWQPMPLQRLPFPSVVVASSNDEYVTLTRAESFARAWGSRFVNAGALGHINSASGLGDWPEGRALLERL